jgi:hypothetical protein
MNRTDLAEALAIWREVVAAVAAAPIDRTTTEAAELRRACGVAQSGGRAAIQDHAFGAMLRAVFDGAGAAGAAPEFFSRVRAIAEAAAPASPIASTVANLAIRLALASEGAALAATTFTSRSQVEAALARVRDGFEAAIDSAMDERQGQAFAALSALYAAVARDLTERARALPRMVSYDAGVSQPSVTVAHRLYADASRAGALVAENAVVHPLFMPAQGRALAF